MARAPGSGGKRGQRGATGERDQPAGREAIEEIERRLGGLLGPLGDALGRMVDAAEQAAQGAEARQGRSGGDAGGGAGPLTAKVGLRVQVGDDVWSSGFDADAGGAERPAPAGETAAAPASRPSPSSSSSSPAPSGPRAAEYEAWTDGGVWTLCAEFPGATEEDVSWAIRDGRLTVSCAGARARALETEAPPVPAEAIRMRLCNGVLELSAELPE